MKKVFLLAALSGCCLLAGFSLNAQEYGVASFYANDFQGDKTASGELYDMNKLTAAHKMLPFGTRVKVTRMDNNKSVIVRVNDRGPYIAGRVIEVSYAAAKQLGMVADGQVEVRLDIMGNSDISAVEPVKNTQVPAPQRDANPTPTQPTTANTTTTVTVTPIPAPEKPKTQATTTTTAASTSPATPAKPQQAADQPPLLRSSLKNGLYKIEIREPEHKGLAVQIAALGNYESVMEKIAELQGKWFDNILVSAETGGSNSRVYKVMLGPFDDRKAADNYLKNLKRKYKMSGFVVDLASITY
ncbi:MAG: septal ring lytic transglycosylase RlpA family protein [Lewinellaceae bacterium]|nr:septal ring lytic transglycosylase RlpA family protein [Lewinellaceae bacterium]